MGVVIRIRRVLHGQVEAFDIEIAIHRLRAGGSSATAIPIKAKTKPVVGRQVYTPSFECSFDAGSEKNERQIPRRLGDIMGGDGTLNCDGVESDMTTRRRRGPLMPIADRECPTKT
jgi:hypothetical protein